MKAFDKYSRAIRNQERLEQCGWIKTIIHPGYAPIIGRKLNVRQARRFRMWGRVAGLTLLRIIRRAKNQRQ